MLRGNQTVEKREEPGPEFLPERRLEKSTEPSSALLVDQEIKAMSDQAARESVSLGGGTGGRVSARSPVPITK